MMITKSIFITCLFVMFISYHQQYYYDSSSILFVSSFIIVSNKPFILLSHDNSIISNLQIKKNMIGLNMIKRDSSSSSSSSSSRSIEELYQLAMKEDEEWYNSFIKDVLGENEVIDLDISLLMILFILL